MVQILDEASMGYLVDELDNHIEKKVIPTILQYQGGSEPEVATLNGEEASDHESVNNEAETIILHVIDKLKGAGKSKVRFTVVDNNSHSHAIFLQIDMCLRKDTSYSMKPAIAIRAENVPNIDWSLYRSMRESVLSKHKEIANFKQPRDFRASILKFITPD